MTATALVTLALLGVRDRALTLGQVRRVLEPLSAYLAERELPHSGEALRANAGVRRVLGALAQQNVVTVYTGGEEPVYAIERAQRGGNRLTVGFPISLRTQDEPQGGNRFTGARFAAPMSERDPAARIAAVRQFVLNARTASAAAAGAVPAALAPALGWLPAPVIGIVSGLLTSTNDVQVSSIPGVPYPVHIAGSRITHMYPWCAKREHQAGCPASNCRTTSSASLICRLMCVIELTEYVPDRALRSMTYVTRPGSNPSTAGTP